MAFSINWPIKLLISITLFAAIFIIDMFIEKPLYNITLEWLRKFPENYNKWSFTNFMNIYTDWSMIFFTGISTLYAFYNTSKIKQIMFVDTVILCSGAICFLKNFYRDSRPCWEKDIKISCVDSDYGNPSVHTGDTGVFIFSALILYWTDRHETNNLESNIREINPENEPFFSKLPIKILITLLTILGYGLLIFSRIYIGMHSIDQVIHGFLLALFFSFTIMIFFKEELESLYKHIFENRKEYFAIILLISLWIVLFAAHLIYYHILSLHGVSFPSNNFDEVRKNNPDFTEKTPLDRGILAFGVFGVIIGAHFGILFSRNWLNEYFDNEQHTNHLVNFGKLCVKFTVAIFFWFLLFISIPDKTQLIIIKLSLPFMLAGFLFFGVGDVITFALGLSTKNEAFKNYEEMKLKEFADNEIKHYL